MMYVSHVMFLYVKPVWQHVCHFFKNVLHLGSSAAASFIVMRSQHLQQAVHLLLCDTKYVVYFVCVGGCGQHYNNGNIDMILFMPVQNKIALKKICFYARD